MIDLLTKEKSLIGETYRIENFKEHFDRIYSFCARAVDADKSPYVKKNMAVKYWASNKSSLLHRIYIDKSIKFLTIVNDLHISGVEHYNDKTAILGKRHFCMPDSRMAGLLQPFTMHALPAQVEWCINKKYKVLLITYNEELNWLAEIHRRIIAGRGMIGYPIQEDSILKKFTEHSEKVQINGYDQYVFYHKLDKRYRLEF